MPSVTIIIATFNSERLLSSTLDSVLKQRYQDWECLVVDGASTDGTLSIISKFEDMDDRFHHISEPDNGVYDAFNKGIQLARGTWLHFLGSDDVLTKDSYCDLMIKAKDSQADVISGSINVLKSDGQVDLLKSGGWEGCHQAKLTRHSSILRMNGYNLKYHISADLDLYVRMRCKGLSIENFDTLPICIFTMGGMSQKIQNLYDILLEYFQIFSQDPSIRFPHIKSCYIIGRMFAANIYHKIRKSL